MSYFLLQQGGKSSRVRVESFPIAVGRDAVNGIVIDDPAASRFHLKVKKTWCFVYNSGSWLEERHLS